MKTDRLEIFSDAVFAIILTIMVLELVPPEQPDFAALLPLVPIFTSYVLSFVFISIYWNNHHHLLRAASQIDGRVLWANLFLLFWISLIPFTTAWMGETGFAQGPLIAYGLVLIMAAVGYFVLVRVLVSMKENADLAGALGNTFKERVSIVLYAVGIGLTFINPWLAFVTYVIVAVLWFIPDPRIEEKPEIIHDD